MKLNLIKGTDAEGKQCVVGWNFTAENEQEEKDLSVVRNHIFFGLDETYPKYAGRKDNEETKLVESIWYRIPAQADRINNPGGIKVDDPEASAMLRPW
jgi:hypothetical protein